jgi:hypothetical protein
MIILSSYVLSYYFCENKGFLIIFLFCCWVVLTIDSIRFIHSFLGDCVYFLATTSKYKKQPHSQPPFDYDVWIQSESLIQRRDFSLRLYVTPPVLGANRFRSRCWQQVLGFFGHRDKQSLITTVILRIGDFGLDEH